MLVSLATKTLTDNPPQRIYINKIENRATFKAKTGHYLEHLTPETMKFLEATKDKIVENVPHLQIMNIVL